MLASSGPRVAERRCTFAHANGSQEKLPLAEYHFRKALAINRNSPVLQCCVGMVLHATGKSEEALQLLDESCLHNPENAQVPQRARSSRRMPSSGLFPPGLLFFLFVLHSFGSNVRPCWQAWKSTRRHSKNYNGYSSWYLVNHLSTRCLAKCVSNLGERRKQCGISTSHWTWSQRTTALSRYALFRVELSRACRNSRSIARLSHRPT